MKKLSEISLIDNKKASWLITQSYVTCPGYWFWALVNLILLPVHNMRFFVRLLCMAVVGAIVGLALLFALVIISPLPLNCLLYVDWNNPQYLYLFIISCLALFYTLVFSSTEQWRYGARYMRLDTMRLRLRHILEKRYGIAKRSRKK